jgi:hypothetical protein
MLFDIFTVNLKLFEMRIERDTDSETLIQRVRVQDHLIAGNQLFFGRDVKNSGWGCSGR